MIEVKTIGLDLAKNVFQADGAGAPVFRRELWRDQVLALFVAQPSCIVAMEACPGAHHRGWEISKLGHTKKLIAPAYVKPFVKRQKNDAAMPRRSVRPHSAPFRQAKSSTLSSGVQKGLRRTLADCRGVGSIRRACSRSILPRPYICRFTSLSFVICPSIWPFNHGSVIAA